MYIVDMFFRIQFIFLGIHWSIPISALGLFGFLLTLPFVLLFGSTCFPENSINRIYMLLTGVTEFVSQAAIVVTAKIENAGTGTLLTIAFDVIITFIGQYLFFKVHRYICLLESLCLTN